MRILISVPAQNAGGLPMEAVMWITESTFRPKRIAGHKKSPKFGKHLVDRTGATKPDQLVVCTEAKWVGDKYAKFRVYAVETLSQ